MEFVQSYASDDDASNNSNKELHQKAVRPVYFVKDLQMKWSSISRVQKLHRVCCTEEH